MILKCKLEGAAKKFVQNLPSKKKDSVEKVLIALKNQYQPADKVYHWQQMALKENIHLSRDLQLLYGGQSWSFNEIQGGFE